MTTLNKRDRLVDSAAELFHRQGMTITSLADIAKHAEIPIGNVYYYFKTKEELALAALEKRRQQFIAAYALLDDAIADPRQRLIEAVSYYDKVREQYAKHGCPIGRIVEDADASKDNVAKAASQIFNDFVEWSERQFHQLGHTEEGKRYAISLMAGIQGAIIMAKAFGTSQVLSDEIIRLTNWIASIPNRKVQLGKTAFFKTVTSAEA